MTNFNSFFHSFLFWLSLCFVPVFLLGTFYALWLY